MRVAFYGRVSTEEQADRGNINSQVEFAEKYFALHGPEENIESYEMYLDRGVSGTIPLEERPEGGRLLADIRAGRISAVYFYRLDRLARSTRVVLNTFAELEKLNVPVKSMTEAFDTGIPAGKFFMTLLAGIAALERETILERTRIGKERKAREGCWTSGPPPFGYRIGPGKRLVVHGPEAETVRLIFRLYNGGMSMVPLACYLNAMGVPTPAVSKAVKNLSTGLWHAAHISIILRSPVYAGEYRTMRRSRYNRDSSTIQVPAIVSADDFMRANRLLLENGDNARSSRGRRYLLSGLVHCGQCGLIMVGNSVSRSRRHYYRCSGTVNRGRGKSCLNRQIRAADLEREIWADIRNLMKNPGKAVELARSRLDKVGRSAEPVDNELAAVERAISAKKTARFKILSLAARSLISEEEAEKELGALASDVELLLQRRDRLISHHQNNRAGSADSTGFNAAMEKLLQKIDGLEPPVDVIRLLVKKVVVKTEEQNGKKVSRASIYYRFGPPSL